MRAFRHLAARILVGGCPYMGIFKILRGAAAPSPPPLTLMILTIYIANLVDNFECESNMTTDPSSLQKLVCWYM